MDSGAIDWTFIVVGIALAGLMLATTRSIRADMRGIRADMRDIRADIRALSDRLDKRIDEQDAKLERLSERLGRLEQEQARMNGVLETLPERLGRLEQEQARIEWGAGDDTGRALVSGGAGGCGRPRGGRCRIVRARWLINGPENFNAASDSRTEP